MAEEETKKKSNPVWYILGTIAALVIGFFIYNHVVSLEKQLQTEKQNLAYANDSLRIARTDLGFISKKYANVISTNDSIVKVYEEQGKELAVLQQVNLQLTLELESDTAAVDTSGGTLTAVFTNTQSDSGLILTLKDSVVFSKNYITNTWVGNNYPFIEASMWYNMVITRDEDGLLSGSLETFSPSLSASLLETKIVDNYVPPLPAMPGPSVFAITAGGSYYYANVGLLLRLGRWGFNPSYNLVVSDNFNPSWYKRLDVRVAYFIW